MVSDGTEFAVNDWVLVATHPLSSATRKVVAKFKPKFEGPYRVLDVKNNNVVIWKAGKTLTINVDQVRIYRHRKCNETEIGTGSSDSGNLRNESSGFDRVQRRSNESRDGKKKGSEVKRELEEKGLSFRNNQGEKHTKRKRRGREGNAHHKWLQSETKKGEKRGVPTDHREEDTTRRTSLIQKRQRKELQKGPYIEERTRSSNKNARRGVGPQRQDQERRGTCTKKSLSQEVLVGNANYKS
ncbi:uncharacterized protein TNCV_1918571 [Trichonephila clavipes]|nr:uncharacterized protein TNCV_1918571 [Trichonephila clavipes]